MTRERKWILMIGGLALIAGAVYRFGLPTGRFSDTGAAVETREMQIEKYRKLAATRKPLETRLKALRNTLEKEEKRLVRGQKASLAAVQIQNRVKSIVEKQGVQLKRMNFNENPAHDNPWYLPVQVQFAMRATIRQLRNILHEIESDPILMNVVNFSTRVVGGNRNDKRPVTIEGTVTVEGYMRWEKAGIADSSEGS